FYGTFNSSSDYNASDINDTPSGGGSNNLVSRTFTFIDEDNNDFRLAETDTGAIGQGVNLYVDQYINITSDIDGANRPVSTSTVSWDIGADQTARKIYRSVGPSNTSALADYAGEGVMTLTATSATFASGLPNKVGVGDVIQYDTDNTGGVDSLAFIQSRASSTEYAIRDKNGENITVASTSITSWEIYRAYTSLSNAEAGTENTGLDNSLEAFELYAGGRDIKTNNEQWNIVAYADAADSDGATINGWDTGAQNFIKIYTPVNSTEVGLSQRHNGLWNKGAYRIDHTTSGGWDRIVFIYEDYTVVDGLQIGITYGDSNVFAIDVNTDVKNVTISNSIVKGNSTANDLIGYGINSPREASKIFNNIVYGFRDSNSANGECIRSGYTSSNKSYTFNNTVYDCYIGYKLNGSSASNVLKNNISQNSVDGYNGTLDSQSDNNISDISQTDADDVNNNFDGYKTVRFADLLNKDFHLSSIDRTAKNAGTSSVSSVVSTDIDGHTYDATGEGWDIGADEAANAVFYSI
ncbi:hypothetical protein C0584_03130, partial [Candidatus Parcubacteria bacterium]